MGIISRFPGGGDGFFLYGVSGAKAFLNTSASLRLTWTNPAASTGWTGTKIVYKANSVPQTPIDGAVVDCGAAAEAIVSGLTTGVTYYFVVMACAGNRVNFDEKNSVGMAPLAIGAFADTPWSVIDLVCKSGIAPSCWAAGDTKVITFASAVLGSAATTVEILGFNYDDLADGSGKAAMSVAMTDVFANAQMLNTTQTSVGGWGVCALRSTLISSVLPAFQSALGDGVIKPVLKNTSAGNCSTAIETTTDSIWLLSQYEIAGSATATAAGEKPSGITARYPAFTDAASRKRTLNGAAQKWWTRSPLTVSSFNGYFTLVGTGGSTSEMNKAHVTHYVSLGFCV